MDVTRQQLIRSLQDRLGARKLVWVGTRGHDGACLMDLPQFSESYAIIAPLGSVSLAVDLALEEISAQRVDLDVYRIEDDRSQAAQEFRRQLLDSLTEPAVVVAYRPSALLSALCYPRSDFVSYMGMFHERQATFEHKPWVENELRRNGIPIIPWRYFAEEDRQRLEEKVAAGGTLVVRANRSDGGAGLRIISNPEEIGEQISDARDGFIAATPLLEPHIPININACVFRDGTISLHPASIQLIGIQECTRRRFGYCGNDFAAIKELDTNLVLEFESMTRGAGRWLWSQGYLGAFGVDALIHGGKVLLAEINPRLQGSSSLSARIDGRMMRADIFLCHLAAHIGLPLPSNVGLEELVQMQPGFSQVIYHNSTLGSIRVERLDIENGYALELLPASNITIEQNATVFRAIAPGSVTRDGSAVDPAILTPMVKLVPASTLICHASA